AAAINAPPNTVDFTPLLNNNESVANQTVVGFQADLSSITVHNSGPQFGVTGRIQEGINDVASGGTVNVLAGSYVDNVAINKSLHLIGQGQGVTTLVPALSAPGTNSGTSLAAGASTMILVQSSDVEISGLTLDGNNPALTSGVVVGGQDVDARNGIIEDTNLATAFNNTNVHDLTVKNIYLRGIQLGSGGNNFKIDGNTVNNVQGSSDFSISIFARIGSGEIVGNHVDQAADAISANHSRGILFQNNVITHAASGIHTDNSGDGGGTGDIIQNNQVSSGTPGAFGIFTFFSYLPVLVKDNTITDVATGLGVFGQSVATANTTFDHNAVSRGAAALADSVGVMVATGGFGFVPSAATPHAIITN